MAALLLLLATFGMVIYLMTTIKKDEKFTTSEILTETGDIASAHLSTIDLQTTIEAAVNDANGPLLPYTARSGMIVMWCVPSPPPGWVMCNGKGTLSDGKTPVPDLTGRFPYGATGAIGFAKIGGEGSVTLSTANIPSHSHSQSNTPQRGHQDGCPQTCWGGNSCSSVCDMAGLMTGATGGGQSFDIIPPYTGVYFIIKL